MLDSAVLLLMNAFLLILRISPGDCFPKPLNAAEEREMLAKWENGGDIEARNTLVEHNLRLVAHIIKKYYTQSCEQDDLISIGTIGLIKGITTYRADKNVKLATYASRCVENEILMYFRSQRKSSGELSLSESLDGSGEDGNLSLLDVISVPDEMLDDISASETATRLASYIRSALDEREETIIRLRYGIGGQKPKTQRETAEKLGISRSYVSRIEKRALTKLKKEFDRDDE